MCQIQILNKGEKYLFSVSLSHKHQKLFGSLTQPLRDAIRCVGREMTRMRSLNKAIFLFNNFNIVVARLKFETQL